ncbi:MAG TPA: HD domain-containing protein [Chthoniobacteraceae bacterium]
MLTLGIKLTDEQQAFILAAALLHDVGHGPFSHAFEKVTGDNHETRTLEVIQDSTTEIHRRLVAFHPSFPQQLGMFFDEDWEAPSAGEIIPSFLTELVSSQLDGDRFDYLLRDSHATGTEYGRFDRDWIIAHLYLDDHKGAPRFFVSSKAFLPTEAYIFARYHMYRTVYFHKATRAAEVMLKLLFQRFKEVVADNSPSLFPAQSEQFPTAIANAFRGHLSLADYLDLDDFALSEFFKSCERCNDGILRELGHGLLHRRLYKAIELSDRESNVVAEFRTALDHALREAGADMAFHFGVDTPADTPYKPYDPDDDKPAAQIYVQSSAGRIVEISTISNPVDELKKKYQLTRYYYPPRFRDEVASVARSTLSS